MNKRASLLLIAVLTMLSLMEVVPNAMCSTNKPSVPEFTAELIDSSYDVPATSSTDPYTGNNVVHDGYRVESRTIEFKIKNQPFTPYQIQDSNGDERTVAFCYNIRYKAHSSEYWTEMFLASDGYPRQDYESENTVFSYQGEYSPTEGLEFNHGSVMTRFPPGAQVDFQVESMIGYTHNVYTAPLPFSGTVFEGETSGWSNTQTLTIATKQLSSHSISVPTILVVALTVAIAIFVAVGILVYFKRLKRECDVTRTFD